MHVVEAPEASVSSLRQSSGRRRVYGAVAIGVALVVLVLLSLAIGSKPIPISRVVDVLLNPDGSDAAVIVLQQRVPRTVVAILVGSALAVAGALMQGLTRNPLADPGLLGVGAGASFSMAIGITLFPGMSMLGLVWCSFIGAIATTIVVYLVGSAGRGGASPLTLTLAGVAIGAVLAGITSTMTILNASTFVTMRFWQSGALDARHWDVIATVAPFILLGLILGGVAARGLNAVALGEDLATALGTNLILTRTAVVVAVTLLCGAATAAVGPIWFVGLMLPHVARWLVGPDHRWILAYTAVMGPVLLLSADVIGRVVVRPDEIPAGIVTAFLGAPVLIVLARRHRASTL